MTWQFSDMTSSLFLGFVVFFLSSFITVPSFMSLSWPVLELWQFSFIKDWPEIRKSEIPPSKFCPVSGDWGKLVILNSARRSQIKCYCQGVCVRVRARARVCVCVCARARVCVCLYSSTVETFSDCKISETYLRGTDERCYVVSIIPGASAKFLHLHF